MGGTALSDQVYRKLRQDILTLAISPGSIVQESELMARYSIGKTPLRESLNRLRQERLVMPIPNRGYIVAGVSVTDVRDNYQLRLILEPEAAAIAAQNITAQQVEEMENRIPTETGIDLSDYRCLLEYNRDFHLKIAEATGNRELLLMMSGLYDRIYRFMYLAKEAGRIEVRVQSHRDIVQRLKMRDSAGARGTMRSHIEYSMENILRVV